MIGLMILLAAGAQSTSPDTQYMIWGWGSESCGSWSAAAQRGPSDSRRIVYKSWLTGFLTASNLPGIAVGRPVYDTDAEGAVGWVDNYCKTYPLKKIVDASMQLTFKLEGIPATGASKE
jgi:hypothetical protein